MFGNATDLPITEATPFHPTSPYAIAKLFSYWMTVNYRESYNLFAVNGILFNHESPRRGETFVTRKITRGLARIKAGIDDTLYLGNLDAKRDWGHAKDYVRGMWMMLQAEKPDDYILATNETQSVRAFIEAAAPYAGMKIEWKGSGVDEIGIDTLSGKTIIKIDARYFRPTEVNVLLGDASKAKRLIGWEPQVHFEELVRDMATADLIQSTL
jgi:GDPmannose 4,6-dehydratase